MTNLVTLGSLQLNGDSGQLLAGRRKVLALLAYLVRRSPDPVSRAELALLLWSDRNDSHAKQSLRQALGELRPILGDALLADADSVLVDSEFCVLDVRVFEDAVRNERWEEAGRLWGGDFLDGLDSLAGEAWATWLAGQRTALRLEATSVFRALYDRSERGDERKAATEWSQRWSEVAPLDEEACSARINALVRAGRPVDAAVCYEVFIRRLHNESQAMPSAAFEALKEKFAAGRAAPTGTVLVRGTMTLSGLAQLGMDARAVAEAAAVIDRPADAATLQAISRVTSISFKYAIAELAQHGILVQAGEGQWEFASRANRDQVFGVISRDRRATLQRAVAERFGTPVEPQRTVLEQKTRAKKPAKARRIRPLAVLAASAAAVVLVAGTRWAVQVATASAVELKPGSTVMLDHVNAVSDPALAGAVNAAATLGLSQSRHVALYRPNEIRGERNTGAPPADRIRALARRERIKRIIALDVTGTDSALRVAARLLDGSSGELLGEESIDTHRASLVDDLDRLLRKVRVTLGESEAIVRDSSRLLREVGSASIEALSAYAVGMEEWSADRAEGARAAWTRALKQDSTFALAELALANDAFTRNAADEGDKWVRRAVSHAERLTVLDALRARQILAMRDGRYGEASKLATQVAQRAPSSRSWFDVGSVLAAGDRCADAISAFERSLATDSAYVPARLGLAECAIEEGNVAVALKQVEAVRRIDSTALSASDYALHRGRALARVGRYAEADSAFRAMFSASPVDSGGALRWLAQLQMMRGRYGEALQMMNASTRLVRQSGDAQALFANLVIEATAYAAIGGRTRASELIDEAVSIAISRQVPTSGFLELGHLMARVGRLNGAREILRQASIRTAQDGATSRWAIRLLNASIHIAERNPSEAMAAVTATGSAGQLEPFRLALTADANAMAGHFEAALDAARRLERSWHFGDAAQDEWLRATLRVARTAELAGDTATARATYRKYVDRWKEADVFLVELSAAQRALVRLGGTAVASAVPATRGSR